MALTYSKIKSLKPKEKLYKLSDEGGLAIWVYPNGRKRWALSYREDGKQKTAYLGEYPVYSLAEAREWRDGIKERLAKSLPAIEEKKSDEVYLFQNFYKVWFVRWAVDQKSQANINRAKSAIEANVLNYFYNEDIRHIKPFQVVDSLRGLEARGVLHQLKLVKGLLSLMLGYASDIGMIDFNPVAAIGRKAFKKAESKHRAALSPGELPLLIEQLENGAMSEKVQLAIYWQLLTMTRPIETVTAQWDHICLEEKQWVIPREIMKKDRDHIIPLSDFATSILLRIKRLNKNGIYLFEGYSNNPHINRGTLVDNLNRAGVNSSAHGMRALAGTTLEELGYPEPVIKAALAHAKGGGDLSTPAYLRSTFYNERVVMMEELGKVVSDARDDYWENIKEKS